MNKLKKNLYKIILIISVLILLYLAFVPFLEPFFVKHNVIILTPIIKQYIKFLGDNKITGSYIEAFCGLFGAFVGTYLAIRGSLYQYRMDVITKENTEIKTAAKLVYYDYYFIEDEISKMVPYLYENIIYKYDAQSLKSGSIKVNLKDIFLEYNSEARPYVPQVFVLDNWIEVTSKLSPQLSERELKLLFNGYGKINAFKKIFDLTSMSNAEIYSITFDFLDLFYKILETNTKDTKFNEQFVDEYHNLVLKLENMFSDK